MTSQETMTSEDSISNEKLRIRLRIVTFAVFLLMLGFAEYMLSPYSSQEIRSLNISACEKEELKKMFNKAELVDQSDFHINNNVLRIAKNSCERQAYSEKEIKEQNARRERIVELLK
jgi:hypothetical protein